jgi:Mrp family chromosome partitioning ATPase
MGKLLDTLRKANPGPRLTTATPPVEDAPAEEASFIEIGPRREVIAASADVLASNPRPRTQPAPAAHAAPELVPTAPGPSVQFRSMTPMPGSLPALRRPHFAQELVAFHAPHGPEAARYMELFSAVREAAATKAVIDQFVLLLSGLRAGIGSTTVLLNVGICAARQDRRTLVVDANLRRPALATRVGVDRAPGLSEVLAADCSLEAAIRPTGLEGLSVLTAGEPQTVLADVRTVQDLLARMREQFDFVLIDGPAWDGRTTVTALAGASDAVFLVLPVAEADGPAANVLTRDLPRQGVRLAGTILTGH